MRYRLSSPRHVARQAAALTRVVREARRAHGAGRLATVRRARLLRRRQHFEYEEALGNGLFDPALGAEDLRGFVSDHENTAAQRRLNGEDSPVLVTDKGVLYLYCRALGLPAPELLGIIHRVGDGWIRPQVVVRDGEEWERALATLPSGLVVKPTQGHGGNGVRVLERREGLLVDPLGRAITPRALWDALRTDPEYDCHVVQERVRNHPDLARLAGPETLHTVRIVTLVRDGGAVEVLWAALKLGIGGSGVDNIAHGTSGNAFCGISDDDGSLMWTRTPRPGGYGTVATPPPADDAGRPARVPMWDEACALVRTAAPHFLPLRTLGWDIAITPEGPVIIEANAHWGAEVTPRMAAVFARMRGPEATPVLCAPGPGWDAGRTSRSQEVPREGP